MILDQKKSCPEYGRRFKSREGKSAPPPPVNKGLKAKIEISDKEPKISLLDPKTKKTLSEAQPWI